MPARDPGLLATLELCGLTGPSWSAWAAAAKVLAVLPPLVQQRTRWEQLRALVTRETRSQIDLSTGVSIEVTTSSFRRARGRTYAMAVCDEVAFWADAETGANPAGEVINAIRPALATLHGPLIGITTVFAKAGIVYDTHAKYYGVEDAPVLVWLAPSKVMNPG